VLIELGPVRLLTDPVLRARVAHLRRHAPAAEPPARLDAILLSHLHLDHADAPSLKLLAPGTPVVVPAGAGRLVRGLGFGEVIELREGETASVAGAAITAVQADHEGRRSPLHQPVDALGFVVEHAGRRVYFAGDTDLFDGMADLRPLDAALLPIWGWGHTLGKGHMDPLAAAEAAALLGARVVVPIHWGTYLPIVFKRGHHLLRRPAETFSAHAAAKAPACRVVVLAPGESVAL
jgi:L-ascorbate metabolism protein UlaG (beta-lactamase superfamily)